MVPVWSEQDLALIAAATSFAASIAQEDPSNHQTVDYWRIAGQAYNACDTEAALTAQSLLLGVAKAQANLNKLTTRRGAQKKIKG